MIEKGKTSVRSARRANLAYEPPMAALSNPAPKRRAARARTAPIKRTAASILKIVRSALAAISATEASRRSALMERTASMVETSIARRAPPEGEILPLHETLASLLQRNAHPPNVPAPVN